MSNLIPTFAYNVDINIQPKIITKILDKLIVRNISIDLFSNAYFIVDFIDINGDNISTKYIDMTPQVYSLWLNDDDIAVNWLLNKYNLTKQIITSPYYDSNGNYIIPVNQITYTYTVNQINLSNVLVKLYTSALFDIKLKDVENNVIIHDTYKMTTPQYLQWMSDDTYIKRLALEKYNLIEII